MSPSFSKHAVVLLRVPWAWRRGSCLGFQDLPATGMVSIQELAANSGSSWMKLLNVVKCNLKELTTKSACVPVVIKGVFEMYMHEGFHGVLS